MTVQWECIPDTYEFPPNATRHQRKVLRLEQDAQALENALQSAADVSERVEFVTRQTTAIALRMIAGERRRNEDKGNHIAKLCRSLSHESRRRLWVLGQQFDDKYRVLVGKRTESD
ncbi:hypothetical protein [Alicyclobacillus dauci]|uniref:Uncharacterized protein n=1 Tax=Alicyclobacillus dauci TaxID=1475485 RepID=A0ABY6YZC6_9BACL|nr:hypothetical protein [Alicyclobacillus dauci]WAH35974.1 hypothetical protein NZD86_17145 [Alicyclobacillus dauci]